MDSKLYEIVIASKVLEKISEIGDYIADNFSETFAKKRIADIFDSFETLQMFPQVGFDADERVGFRIDNKHKIKGVVILGKYIALYSIDEKNSSLILYIYFQLKRIT